MQGVNLYPSEGFHKTPEWLSKSGYNCGKLTDRHVSLQPCKKPQIAVGGDKWTLHDCNGG